MNRDPKDHSLLDGAVGALDRAKLSISTRSSFLAAVKGILTRDRRFKTLPKVSYDELIAWTQAFGLLSRHLREEVQSDSESESDLDITADDRIQDLINKSISPKKDFSERVDDFMRVEEREEEGELEDEEEDVGAVIQGRGTDEFAGGKFISIHSSSSDDIEVTEERHMSPRFINLDAMDHQEEEEVEDATQTEASPMKITEVTRSPRSPQDGPSFMVFAGHEEEEEENGDDMVTATVTPDEFELLKIIWAKGSKLKELLSNEADASASSHDDSCGSDMQDDFVVDELVGPE